MRLISTILGWIAGGFKVPQTAMRMFQISNEISGIDRNTLPTELIPLNSIQLSRGLLNFTILQSLSNWILPYWAEKQYDSQNKSFIPRSHLGLSINVTNRNWTAIGTPGCPVEPVVDPAGMVTPFINGWSIDTWLKVDNEVFFPSKANDISQKLVEDLPVVETRFIYKDIELVLTTFTEDNILVHQAEIKNKSEFKKECEIIFSIRPFNPEGISIIDEIAYSEKTQSLLINREKRLYFKQKPNTLYFSNLKCGDPAALLYNSSKSDDRHSSSCKSGMSSMAAVYSTVLEPDEKYSSEAFCFLEGHNNKETGEFNYNRSLSFWKELISEGASVNTPDERINSLYTASVSSLLLLRDNNLITPGPFIYHQFWFRDAAYMIWALDKLGYSKYTSEIISSYPSYQLKDGYFRSQKGEWDSNGQAVWSIYQHSVLSNNYDMLNTLFNSLLKGIRWIDKKRLISKEYKDKPYYGLLPAGLSAEHLGLADYYFWDNMWSIAGIEAFAEICKVLDKQYLEEYTANLLTSYKSNLLRAIEVVQNEYKIKGIPASPTRSIDCGMIGSVCASYPLQVILPSDKKMVDTLDTLVEKYFVKEMFFQNFIHSGLNIYLTLQVAHAYLYAGNRNKFWDILSNVINSASCTLNYPEAIHPLTGGGCMGDGHHGWVSAEIVLALHEAFVYESKNTNTGEKSLVFLHGIPADWFIQKKSFSIKNTHTSAGIISVECKVNNENYVLEINPDFYSNGREFQWVIKLPFKIDNACQEQTPLKVEYADGESIMQIKPGKTKVTFRLKKQ